MNSEIVESRYIPTYEAFEKNQDLSILTIQARGSSIDDKDSW